MKSVLFPVFFLCRWQTCITAFGSKFKPNISFPELPGTRFQKAKGTSWHRLHLLPQTSDLRCAMAACESVLKSGQKRHKLSTIM